MTQPQPAPRPVFASWSASRFLMVVGAVCFFLAALTVCGVPVLSAHPWAWGFGGFSAWMLAGAV